MIKVFACTICHPFQCFFLWYSVFVGSLVQQGIIVFRICVSLRSSPTRLSGIFCVILLMISPTSIPLTSMTITQVLSL